MSGRKIFLVANSHIDPVWLWDKYEGIDEVLNTFRSVCDMLEEYPDLRFSASSACFYKWVERYDPDLFRRIKEHVLSGRWEITGGWWVEMDCNLPTAESFYKSAEISKGYISSRFGVDVLVAYSPDSFGHAATLPKILSECGFKYYIFCRPERSEKPDLPGDLFYWEYEGKRILCYRLKYHYSQGLRRFEDAISDEDFLRNGIACYFFGTGDHGRGPRREEIEYFLRMSSEIKDPAIRFSSCLEFFEEAEKLPNIPVYCGDLHYHAIGCYSVNRTLKQAIRSSERLLSYTKRVLDVSGISEDLDPLWERVLFNQFHDMMGGTSSPEATDNAIDELGCVRTKALEISYSALKTMSASIKERSPEGEFRIFNSLPYPVTGPFEIESFYFRENAVFKDSEGKEVEIQKITPSVVCSNTRWMFVDTIPPRTMKSYHFDPESRSSQSLVSPRYVPGHRVSLGRFEVESPGKVLVSGEPLFDRPISLGVIEDWTDTWSHGIRGYGPAMEMFEEMYSSICEGPIASFLLSRQRYGSSYADLLFVLYRDLPFFDLKITVGWQEYRKILKLYISPTFDYDSILAEGPGGVIRKEGDGKEEPLHSWLLLGDLGIVQDGAFAFDKIGRSLRITLIRSSLYGYHEPWEIDPLGPLWRTDLGEHRFKFRFFWGSDLSPSKMDMLSSSFLEPFHIIREGL